MKEGFKDRISAGVKQWKTSRAGQPEFTYLTRAYPFYYAMNAAKGKRGAVLKVEVDTDDLFPDEDFIRYSTREEEVDIRDYKNLASVCLEKLGNVAIRPDKIKRIIGIKDFDITEMIFFSDPIMTPLNYLLLGGYYRKLTDTWWTGGDWKKINQIDEMMNKTDLKLALGKK
jgi:hypothetical protein